MAKKLKSKRHKSAVKRARQSLKIAERNTFYKSAVKTAVKKVVAAANIGKKEEALDSLSKAKSLIDKVVSKGIIHRNTGSRKISRLYKLVNSVGVKTATA
ncbi:MAG TPA: 30S ribosomal protein S20 [Nitrospinae bacterium]|nr:30S ribosomal protein S20 [Nitrospinota bacterium]